MSSPSSSPSWSLKHASLLNSSKIGRPVLRFWTTNSCDRRRGGGDGKESQVDGDVFVSCDDAAKLESDEIPVAPANLLPSSAFAFVFFFPHQSVIGAQKDGESAACVSLEGGIRVDGLAASPVDETDDIATGEVLGGA